MGEIDTKRFEHRGVSFLVRIEADYDNTPENFECYDDDDKATYRNADWRFVDIVIVPVVGGVEYPEASQSLWGCEYGTNGDRWTVGTDDLFQRVGIDEGMCDEAIDGLRQLADKFAAAVATYTSHADESEPVWRQTSCRLCGHDVEGDESEPEGEWRDRGGNTTCGKYIEGFRADGEVITPPEGQRHQPAL